MADKKMISFVSKELVVVFFDNKKELSKENPTLTSQIDYRILTDGGYRLTVNNENRIIYT